MIGLHEFNQLDEDEAAALLRPCLDVDRWVDSLLDGRPYASTDELLATARSAASPFTPAELEAALAHHPRIGLALDADVQRQLAEGNRAYEQRFGRVFLIRAAGRSSAEILAALNTRLANDPDSENEVVAEQLRQIALVRLAGAVSA
jgi:2-oxo-4-hydroxy-4-carboxy-5-ureidoimidazoline decarboxylase